MPIAIVIACLVALGCSSPAGPGAAPAGATAAPAAPNPALPVVAGGVGAACVPDRTNPRSSCAGDQICLPAPGGYCTSPCGATGAPCPLGSSCTPSVRGGELCARSCASDADCRADHGYVCDPGRKVC